MAILIQESLWTLADLIALKTAIKSGARRVEYQDKTVEYHSLKEMLALLRIMQTEITGIRTGGGRRTYASFSKGTRP